MNKKPNFKKKKKKSSCIQISIYSPKHLSTCSGLLSLNWTTVGLYNCMWMIAYIRIISQYAVIFLESMIWKTPKDYLFYNVT